MAATSMEIARMPSSHSTRRASLDAARFADDRTLLRAVREDEALVRQLQRTEVLRKNSTLRARLLTSAVRVNTRLIPHVARSLARATELIGTNKPFEAYVFDEPSVRAFVSETESRYLVALSSGAVNNLGAEELEFVIGHELGHAAFGHLEVAVEAVIELDMVDREQCQLLRAWQRAAEISADRVGLLCCDSLEIAATTLFKTMSGLHLPGVIIDPTEFAEQWHGLAQEMMELGIREQWRASHPFPPMRMQALLLFWSHSGRKDVDAEISHLLAHMDSHGGGSAYGGDPLLSRFNFWGGLYMALADRAPCHEMLREFVEAAPPGIDLHEAVRGVDLSSATGGALCLSHFRAAKSARREKLSTRELHALISGFVDVAARDGALSERATAHLTHLGQELGIGATAVRLLINRRLHKDS